jgi:hypothetical protein
LELFSQFLQPGKTLFIELDQTRVNDIRLAKEHGFTPEHVQAALLNRYGLIVDLALRKGMNVVALDRKKLVSTAEGLMKPLDSIILAEPLDMPTDPSKAGMSNQKFARVSNQYGCQQVFYCAKSRRQKKHFCHYFMGIKQKGGRIMDIKAKVKCPFCSGQAVLSKSNLRLFNGALTLKDNPTYECKNCRERFAMGKMVDNALENAKKEFAFTRPVISTGGSLAITLPSDLSEYYGIEKGEKIRLVPKSKKEICILVGQA